MQVVEVARSGYGLIRASGVMDGHTSESDMLSAILSRPADDMHSDYVIDLSQTEYINSSMLGMLVRFLYSCQSSGHALAILSPSPSVESVLRMTGLGELMPILEREEEAPAALESHKEGLAEDDFVDFDRLVDEFEDIIEEEGGEEKAQELRQTGELRKLLGS